MNAKCSKLIICTLWVEVEVARCSGPDVCQRLPKPVNVSAPRPGSAGTCRLCWGHECQMSGTANSLCLRRLFQHFMFTLNASQLNGGGLLQFRKHLGERTAALDVGLKPAELSSTTLCEASRLGGEPDAAPDAACIRTSGCLLL